MFINTAFTRYFRILIDINAIKHLFLVIENNYHKRRKLIENT